MNKNIKYFIIFLCLISLIVPGCGRSVKEGRGDCDSIIRKAEKNIMTAESITDLKRRLDLLNSAESQIKDAEAADPKGSLKNEINTLYAYFYFVSGNYNQAKAYAGKNTNKEDVLAAILNVRILLKEKGRENAKDSSGILETFLAKPDHNDMCHLTLGDSYFLLGKFQEAQKHYTEVLKIGEAFQVQAADRLEIMDQIKRSGIDTAKVQNIILSPSVTREEIADLMQRVFNADKYLKFGKAEKEFSDISGSLYSEAIRMLRGKGFFTYLTGEKFEPFRPVPRGEMAKIIEDFIVFKNGNTALRVKYVNDTKSVIKGIDVKDTFYNAIRTAADAKIMDIPLDGSINPLEPMSGLETLNVFSKLIK